MQVKEDYIVLWSVVYIVKNNEITKLIVTHKYILTGTKNSADNKHKVRLMN